MTVFYASMLCCGDEADALNLSHDLSHNLSLRFLRVSPGYFRGINLWSQLKVEVRFTISMWFLVKMQQWDRCALQFSWLCSVPAHAGEQHLHHRWLVHAPEYAVHNFRSHSCLNHPVNASLLAVCRGCNGSQVNCKYIAAVCALCMFIVGRACSRDSKAAIEHTHNIPEASPGHS